MKRKINTTIGLVVALFIITSCTKTPTACCDVPSTGTKGQAISFNSSCSTDASTYEWDFGDGSTKSTEANPSHTYATAGTFTVSLMAMSSDGKKMNSTTKSIKIN
ncbi:MAG: PKD domain-containing protein [Bacteroidota bacterium]